MEAKPELPSTTLLASTKQEELQEVTFKQPERFTAIGAHPQRRFARWPRHR